MRLVELRQDIQNCRKSGETYYSIATVYHINKAMVWQIEHDYVPGKKVSTILQLEPDGDLQYTRTRRQRLNEIAKKWGFSSWANYETWMLKSN